MSAPESRPGTLLPTVSIIVPVYNGAGTIGLCLAALCHLTYPKDRYEVIVIDNNSTDQTADIVRQFEVRLVHERDIQGAHAAANAGVRQAAGEILAFTDADCVAEPGWLAALVAPFASDDVVATGGRIEAYQPASRVERFLDQMHPFENCIRLSDSFPAAIITGNAAYRADAFRAAGMFEPHMPTGAEVDLAWRVQLTTGKKAVYVADAVVRHKFSPSVRRLFRHFSTYGYSEILLSTLYHRVPGYPRTPAGQLRTLLRQGRALLTYLLSVLTRSLRAVTQGRDADYVAAPLLWLVVESGSIYGKLKGLWMTRFYRRRFWLSGAERRSDRRCA